MASWWCELAAIDGEVRAGVAITAHEGRFTTVVPDTAPPADAQRLTGLTISGLANTHSHAFQRALRSRTQAGTGSFWTWREVMYDAATRLDPDTYHRLARAVFAEMAWMERRPELILRDAVRRMLPKNRLARQMLSKLKLYVGPEHPHQAQQPEPMEVSCKKK